MIKKIISHPLFSGGAIMVGGSMLVNVFNYVYHVVMGRILGPVDYGILASVFALLYIVSIVPLSTSVAITKFISAAKNKKEVSAIFVGINNFTLKVAIFFSILVLISSPLLANFLHIENIFLILFVAPILFLSLTTLVNQATSQGLLRFAGAVSPNLVSSVFKLVFGVTFVVIGWSVFGAIIGVVLGAILSYWFSLQYVKDLKSTQEKFKLRPFLLYAFPVLLQALAFTSFFTTDLLLAKHFLPEFEAGLYAGLSTLGKIVYFAVTPISGAMFPIVSKRISNGESYKKVFFLALVVTIAISVGITLFYSLFPNIAIGILYGDKYIPAASSLVWMGIFMVLYTICYFLMNFLLSIGKTRAAYWSIVVLILQIVLINLNHNSISEIIIMNIVSMIVLFAGLSVFLVFLNKK